MPPGISRIATFAANFATKLPTFFAWVGGMHGLRWIFSAGTGAVIGVAAVVALDLSFRLLRRPANARAKADTRPAATPMKSRMAIDPRGRPVKAAIIAVAIAGYTLIGYLNRPIAPPPTEPALPAAPSPAADAGPIPLTIGGVTLSFAPPQGSCLYPAPLLEAIKLQQSRINPDNVIHTAFADCAELRDATTSQARIRDFGILMTPKADLTQRFDRAALDAMSASTPDQTDVKATLDQRLATAQSKLALQSFSALGMVDRDPQGIYLAFLSKAQGTDGEYTQACVMAMAAINGRLVSYYLYSDYARDPRPVIFNLLAKAKAGVSDLAERNRS